MGELGGAFIDVLDGDKTHDVTLSRQTNYFKYKEKMISIAKMLIDKCKAAILFCANTK